MLMFYALCFVMSFFFFFWSICRSSSLVCFKNVPKYLSRGTTQVLISLMIFLLWSLVSISFLVLLRFSFLIFFFNLLMFDGVLFQYPQAFLSFHFSERYYFYYSFEFITPALADVFQLVFEWQQTSSSLQDSSRYWWYPLALLFPSLRFPLTILQRVFRVNQLQLVSPSPSSSIIFSSLKRSR